jgi:hypothetical protein
VAVLVNSSWFVVHSKNFFSLPSGEIERSEIHSRIKVRGKPKVVGTALVELSEIPLWRDGCPFAYGDKDTSLAKGGISARQALSLRTFLPLPLCPPLHTRGEGEIGGEVFGDKDKPCPYNCIWLIVRGS